MRERSRSWDRRQLPEGGNGVLAICAGVLVVIAAAVILIFGHGQHQASHHPAVRVSRPVVLAPTPATRTPATTTTTTTSVAAKRQTRSSATRKRIAQQDPQDRRGSKVAKRAARALEAHRALQHVPYRDGNVEIRLTGALKNGTAILTVTAPTVAEGKAGYRRFLARYHDTGRAYRPRFVASEKVHRHG